MARIVGTRRRCVHHPRFTVGSPMRRRCGLRRRIRRHVGILLRLQDLIAPEVIIESERRLVRESIVRYNDTARILRLPEWGTR